MALPHAQPFDRIDLHPLGDGLAQTPSTSLIKSHSLQLMRVVLRAGERLPEHHVRGEITLQLREDPPSRAAAMAAVIPVVAARAVDFVVP